MPKLLGLDAPEITTDVDVSTTGSEPLKPVLVTVTAVGENTTKSTVDEVVDTPAGDDTATTEEESLRPVLVTVIGVGESTTNPSDEDIVDMTAGPT